MSFRNYIIAFVSAIVLAIAAWLVVPHKYAAKVKLCDEYNETDLAVGLDQLSAKIKTMMNSNVGINDMEVYGLTTTFQTWPRGWFHIPKDPDFPVPS